MQIITTNELQNFETLNEILGFEYLNSVQIQIIDKMLITNISKIKIDMNDLFNELDKVEDYANPKQQMMELMTSYSRLADMIESIEKVRSILKKRINHGYPD